MHIKRVKDKTRKKKKLKCSAQTNILENQDDVPNTSEPKSEEQITLGCDKAIGKLILSYLVRNFQNII